MEDKANLILWNGDVWTLDHHKPWSEAVAVKDGLIVKVGSNRDMKEWKGPHTQVVDLKGAMVLPGFIDSHAHFLEGGRALSEVRLKTVKDPEEFRNRIKNRVQQREKGEWILGEGWDHHQFEKPQLPRKEWIDPVSPQNPVCVDRCDMHMTLANSLALKIAGITRETPSPEGGEIEKDPVTGDPTGILKDAAMGRLKENIPEFTLKRKRQAVESAMECAHSKGVTSVHDMGTFQSFQAYQSLGRDHHLTTRIYLFIPVTEIEVYSRLRLEAPFGNDFLKIGGLKGFVDGSLGSSTALFFQPYKDNPQKKGLLHPHMFPEGIMKKRMAQAERARLQMAVHAIGEKANHTILDICEHLIRTHGKRDRRWRIEHVQHLLPQDIPRLSGLNLIASVQPSHLVEDGSWAQAKIGEKRVRWSYPYQSLLQQGTILTFGSDWTVAPMDPLWGIWASVTRETSDGLNPDGWVPEQKVSLRQAIRASTWNGAYAEFSEDKKGSVEKGKLADLVVIRENLFQIPPREIRNAQILMTVFNGQIVYQKKG
ncbi:amidohydrolase [bacterium]|nr:amidohydrolase [bacterium]